MWHISSVPRFNTETHRSRILGYIFLSFRLAYICQILFIHTAQATFCVPIPRTTGDLSLSICLDNENFRSSSSGKSTDPCKTVILREASIYAQADPLRSKITCIDKRCLAEFGLLGTFVRICPLVSTSLSDPLPCQSSSPGVWLQFVL